MLSEARPPTGADGEDGDFFIEDRSALGRGRWMWGPKTGGAWPSPSWRIEAVGDHTAVSDANYQARQSDVQVGMVTLTAPRTIYLPDVDGFPLAQDLVIADKSGACSEAITITVQPGPGTGDIIGGRGGHNHRSLQPLSGRPLPPRRR